MMRALAAPMALLAASAATSSHAEALIDQCVAQTCKARLTAGELIEEVQKLVAEKRYTEAAPMVAALQGVPAMTFQYRFLTGYIASQTGDPATAVVMYRAILVDDPGQTRVRLELARTLFAMGKPQSADHQFRLAAEDRDLPPEIARTIRAARDVIRSKRAWSLDFDVGFAPDSNINNATAADSVTVLFGSQAVPLTLNDDARARSGTGQTGRIDAGLRLPVGEGLNALIDLDAAGTNYTGRRFDDYSFEGAAGGEIALNQDLRLRMQAVGAERLFGGRVATTQWGVKGGFEADAGDAARIGLQLDARRTNARFDNSYSGWQTGLYLNYERVVARSLVASGGVFARRDALNAKSYSSTEYGATLGIGGEMPLGFNVGLGGSLSRAAFDGPQAIFSLDPRRDWRFATRATIGNRAIRWLGFSPTLGVSWGRIDSSLDYYASARTRFRFALARYF